MLTPTNGRRKGILEQIARRAMKERGYEGVDVGSRLKVKFIHTDVEKGFIDFKRVH